jgi:putative chitinase
MHMNLETQFISLGLTPVQAKDYAKSFVAGLEELGLADNPVESNDFVEIVKKNVKIDNALLKIGVRPSNIQKYTNSLDKAMLEFSINTSLRQRMFLSQVLHESGMLTASEENLNYSEQGLLKTFKKYFDRSRAAKYARNPQRIANRVYANRMGNGSEDSGDGWRFRGRGLIQLTGRDNYIACGNELDVDLIKNPDYLLTPIGAARSAGWFWESRKLNRLADLKDLETNTKIINGGFNGLEHRKSLYLKLSQLL